MFSGLEYFQGLDGSIAEWFPVGRVRRTELDVKADKLGSGSFAEVPPIASLFPPTLIDAKLHNCWSHEKVSIDLKDGLIY